MTYINYIYIIHLIRYIIIISMFSSRLLKADDEVYFELNINKNKT